MNRPQFVFRPNLKRPEDQRAWTQLQQIPAGQRKQFLVDAILAEREADRLAQLVRQVVREELDRRPGSLPPPDEKEIPQQTLDFLTSLCSQ